MSRVDHTVVPRTEHWGPITWGTLLGEDIHFACATPEESKLTWGRFAPTEQAPEGKKCPRCLEPLSADPQA